MSSSREPFSPAIYTNSNSASESESNSSSPDIREEYRSLSPGDDRLPESTPGGKDVWEGYDPHLVGPGAGAVAINGMNSGRSRGPGMNTLADGASTVGMSKSGAGTPGKEKATPEKEKEKDKKDGDGGDQFKRKMACMSCRLIKLRCLLHSPTQSHPLDPCKRCVKMGIECEYKPKRRPVKVGTDSKTPTAAADGTTPKTKAPSIPPDTTLSNATTSILPSSSPAPSTVGATSKSTPATASKSKPIQSHQYQHHNPHAQPYPSSAAPSAHLSLSESSAEMAPVLNLGDYRSSGLSGLGKMPTSDVRGGGGGGGGYGNVHGRGGESGSSTGYGSYGDGDGGGGRRESSSGGGIGGNTPGGHGHGQGHGQQAYGYGQSQAHNGSNSNGPSMPDLEDVRRRRQGGGSTMVQTNSMDRLLMATGSGPGSGFGSVGSNLASASSSSTRSTMQGPFGAYDFGGYATGLGTIGGGHPISSARGASSSIDENADMGGGGGGYGMHNDGGTSNMRSTGMLSAYESTPPGNGTNSLPSIRRNLSSYSLPVSDVLSHTGTSAMYRPRAEHTHEYERKTSTARDEHPEREGSPDQTSAKTRLPMALASILDLMRKDLSPPPKHVDVAPAAVSVTGGGSQDTPSGTNAMKRRHSPEVTSSEIHGMEIDPALGAPQTSSSNDRHDGYSGYGDHLLPSGRPEKRTRWHDEQPAKDQTPGASGSGQTTDDKYRLFQLTETAASDPAQKRSSSGEPTINRVSDDPVRLGLVTQEEVQFLFQRYFERHNTYIALLDVALHTPEYCMATSMILYVAILTVTANAFLPERYAGLLAHVNELLGEAFKRSDVEIGLCQALSMLSVWKEGSDRGSWLRVGYAIRIGYELGLDAQPMRPLPEDPILAKEELNKERTWWQLTMFDRTMYHMHGQRPRMIAIENVRDPAEWARDHMEHYCYSDSMLAASFTCGRFLSVLAGNRQQEPLSISYRMILHRLQVENSEWAVVWLGSDPPAPLHPVSRAIIFFYRHVNNFEISEFARLGVPDGDSMEALSESVTNAIQLLRYIVDELDPADVLKFAPDVITLRAAKCGVFLARNMAKIPPILVEEIFAVFKQLIRSCKRASNGQDTAYFQAKFFNSLLRVSSVAPTRVGSRIGSPIPTTHRSGLKPLTSMSDGVPGDALAARLSETLPTNSSAASTSAVPMDGMQDPADDIFHDMDMFPFDEQLSIDALLQESHDWFSLDLMSHINDPTWAIQPVVTLPGPYGLTSSEPNLIGRL